MQEELEASADRDELEERAERVVEIENRLTEERAALRDEPELERTVNLSPSRARSSIAAPVIAVDESGGECELTCRIDGEEETFTVPWPDDATDGREPLVRLCDWAGVPVNRIGDLDEVPILTDGDETRLLVPPGIREAETTVYLPGGRAVTRRRRLLRDRAARAAARVGLVAAETPLFTVDLDDSSFIWMADRVFFTLVVAISIAVGAVAAVHGGLLAGPLVSVLAFIPVFLALDFAIDPIETAGGSDLFS